MKLTSDEIYAQLVAAGYPPAAAATQTAIALAESGGDGAAVGDVSLQDNTWGPSYGLFQIRTVKADTGKGTIRDISWLAASTANQAKAAYDISRHGVDFTPWTVYVTGAYQSFLGQAKDIAGQVSGVLTAPISDAITGVRNLGLEAVFVVLGLGLVGVGLVHTVRPQLRRLTP